MDFRIQSLLLFLSLGLCNSWIIDPGPKVSATRGEVWPKPQQEKKQPNYYVISTTYFHFNVISEYCSILQEAKLRYTELILRERKVAKKYAENEIENVYKTDMFVGYMKNMQISLTGPCSGDEYPELDMDESYTLIIPSTSAEQSLLKANSIWGILRGLETFSQSVYMYDNDGHLYVNATEITDYPKFSHRGLLLDTSRHYLTTDVIYKNLDAMSYNKMNVFHWHIVDDQSFPYQSTLYPELSNKGAYNPKYQIYTPKDVQAIIEYARLRGIRVIPEFDTPGHTRSWGEGIPELLSTCYKNGKPTDHYGPMDPSREFVFSFLNDFFEEIKSAFPEKYLHLGGDEVPFDCWEGNPDIHNFMERINITGNYKALQRYFMERLLNITSSKEVIGIVWEEVYKAGTKVPKDTVIQVWASDMHLLKEITHNGYHALYSSCWYLDHLSSGGDWKKFYECDPGSFGGSDKELKMVLGGEACMWAEVVNNENVLQRTWPRASATAEKLWSARSADNDDHVAKRLEEHACRLNQRNIPAQPPNGPGYCLS